MRIARQISIRTVAAAFALCVWFSGCGKEPESPLSEPDATVLKQVHSNTRRVIEGMQEELQVTLQLDADSILWLDDYINKQRDLITKDLRDQMIEGFGCYLGDSIIEVYGGRWVLHESQGLCVQLKTDAVALPFPAVARQFAPGSPSSIFAMFAKVPEMKKEKPPSPR